MFARGILEKNAAYLQRVDESLRFPKFQFVEADSFMDNVLDPDVHDSIILRARDFYRPGRKEEALEETMKLLRLCRKIRASARHILDLLEAIDTEQRGLETLQDLLVRDEPPKDALRRLREEFSAEGEETEATRRAILGWYGVFVRFLEGPSEFGKPVWFDYEDRPIPWQWASDAFLLPNSSGTLAADVARTWGENAGRSVKDRSPTPGVVWIYALEGWARFLPIRNGIGKFQVFVWSSWIWDAESEEWSLRAQKRLVVAWLALKLHQADRGDFPADLNSLVPQYSRPFPSTPTTGNPSGTLPRNGSSIPLAMTGRIRAAQSKRNSRRRSKTRMSRRCVSKPPNGS